MALRSPLTLQPYDYIGDSTGRPLDKGQIYIGVAGQDPEFYQVPVFLDAEMTKPIDQPIRTNDGFVDFAGSLSELYASAEIYSVKVLDKQGRKVLYKGDMTRKNLMSDALADLNQSIIDAQTAAQITLNAAVNSANTEVAQTVSLATAAIDTATTKSNKAATDADAAIKTMFENGGLPATPFATKALMTASALVDGDYAQVTDDTVNNGLYVKTAGAWVKSDYDPLREIRLLDENTLETNYYNFPDNNLLEVTDARGIQTWLQISPTGGITDHTARYLIETIGYTKPAVVDNEDMFFVLVDKADRICISIDSKGYIETLKGSNVGGSQGAKTDLSTIAFYGSSTMWYIEKTIFAAVNTAYPDIVQTPKFYGTSASRYSHILTTSGINNGYITFTNGEITPNIKVGIGYDDLKYGLTSVSTHYTYGTLSNGVHGRIGGRQFQADNISEPIAIDSDLPIYFTADATSHRNAVAVINIAKNDLTGTVDKHKEILQYNRDLMDWLDKGNNYRTIVIGHFINLGSNEQTHIEIDSINRKLKMLYGDRFFDLQAYILSEQVWIDTGIEKTAEDIAAIEAKELPPSLSRDSAHTSAELDVQIGYKILQLTNKLGWY